MAHKARKEIGLAVIGCGTIGRIRAELARAYPGVGWIGLCDQGFPQSQFHWIDDGAPLTFAVWDAGEPNNSPIPADCVIARPAGWGDRSCTDLRPLVCEWSWYTP